MTRITQEQLEIMFLMVTGCWKEDFHLLTPISGIYLGHDIYITPERMTELRTKTIAEEIAKRILND